MHKDDDKRVSFVDQRYGCFTFELVTEGIGGIDNTAYDDKGE